MREKKDFLGRVGEYLDLPAQVLPGGFSVLIYGGREVCVCGRVSMLAYSEECVRLSLAGRMLSVEGKGLFCTELSAEKVTIIGTVKGLFLEKGDADAT